MVLSLALIALRADMAGESPPSPSPSSTACKQRARFPVEAVREAAVQEDRHCGLDQQVHRREAQGPAGILSNNAC